MLNQNTPSPEGPITPINTEPITPTPIEPIAAVPQQPEAPSAQALINESWRGKKTEGPSSVAVLRALEELTPAENLEATIGNEANICKRDALRRIRHLHQTGLDHEALILASVVGDHQLVEEVTSGKKTDMLSRLQVASSLRIRAVAIMTDSKDRFEAGTATEDDRAELQTARNYYAYADRLEEQYKLKN